MRYRAGKTDGTERGQSSAAACADGPLDPACGLLRLGRWLSIAYIAFALFTVVALSPYIWFRGRREDVLAAGPAILAVALLAGLAIVVAALATRRAPRLDRAFWPAVAAGCALLLAGQAAIVEGAWFLTDWDAQGVVSGAFYGTSWDSVYFSTYPNQTFLMGVFSLIGRAVGASSYESLYRACVLGGCVCLAVSCACMAAVARRVAGPRTGLLAFALCVLLVGLSPWMLVPYSDAYGTLCPALALLAYAHIGRRPLRLGAVLLLSLVGYFVKPTSVFIGAAVVVIELVGLVRSSRRASAAGAHAARPSGRAVLIGWAGCAAAVAMAVAAAGALDAAVTAPYGDLDETKAFSMAHYLMMGANEETNARWSQQDYDYSAGIADPEERTRADLALWRERVEALSPVGVLRLAVKKTFNNYLDGSFWWEGEGSFYLEVKGGNEAIRDFYNVGHEKNWTAGSSENPTPYFFIAQGVWFLVLLGCVAGALGRRPSNAEAAAYVSVLAVSAFLVVFECRARYLFLYAPYFCLLAALGWRAAAHRASGLAGRLASRPRG